MAISLRSLPVRCRNSAAIVTTYRIIAERLGVFRSTIAADLLAHHRYLSTMKVHSGFSRSDRAIP